MVKVLAKGKRRRQNKEFKRMGGEKGLMKGRRKRQRIQEDGRREGAHEGKKKKTKNSRDRKSVV